ncbi:neugrin [Chironomus tepperi]|uniref:neugrin n=1 Tax=Chironomus tepperi TaxID=113505 RepID=UPI00391F0722
MLRGTIKLCNSSVINHLNKLTAIRNYAPRRRRPSKEETEPGINKRLQYFKEDMIANEDPEVIDSMEPNFMNLGDTHRQHERDVKRMREKVQLMIVGKKYFKEKSPNFLTYNEKEQIRTLHEEDSEKWTVDKLSESFPADPYAISQIIRSKWIPKDTNRIFRHDESVKRNWKEFNEGKMEIDPILAEHLKKFAFRDINKLAERAPNKRLGIEFPKPKSNEFLSIVTSCSKYKDEESEVKQIESSELRMPKQRPGVDDNTFIMHGKKRFSSESITLADLQEKNPDINMQVKLYETETVDTNLPTIKFKAHDESNYISLPKDEKLFNKLKIQEKIKIPRKEWKKGKIYKVSDCFYSDDGEFLYRVPGLD